jgi:hypothetical protein
MLAGSLTPAEQAALELQQLQAQDAAVRHLVGWVIKLRQMLIVGRSDVLAARHCVRDGMHTRPCEVHAEPHMQDCLAARQLQSDMLLSSAMAQAFEQQRRQEAEDARYASNLARQPARVPAVPAAVQHQYQAQVTAAAADAHRPDTPASTAPSRCDAHLHPCISIQSGVCNTDGAPSLWM